MLTPYPTPHMNKFQAASAGDRACVRARAACAGISIYLSFHLSIYPSIYASMYLSIFYPSIHLSIYPSIYIYTHLSVYLCRYLYLAIYPPVYLPISILISISITISTSRRGEHLRAIAIQIAAVTAFSKLNNRLLHSRERKRGAVAVCCVCGS